VANFGPTCANPEFLARIRYVIRSQLSNESECPLFDKIGLLVARYGEQCDLDNGIASEKSEKFIIGFLKGFRHTKLLISDSIKLKIVSILKSYLTTCKKRYHMDEQAEFDLMRSFIIRFTNGDFDIESVSHIMSLGCFHLTKLEMRIFDIPCTDLKIYYLGWKTCKHRVIEAWPNLSDTVRKSVRNLFWSEADVLSEDPKNTNYIYSMLRAWRREAFLPGYNTYLTMKDSCTSKSQLTAHLFFVDDFDQEIETAGYLGIVELVFSVSKIENNADYPPQLRE
jgi:hypothetical protein